MVDAVVCSVASGASAAPETALSGAGVAEESASPVRPTVGSGDASPDGALDGLRQSDHVHASAIATISSASANRYILR